MLVNRSGWNDKNALLFNLMLGKKRFIRKLRRKIKLGGKKLKKEKKKERIRVGKVCNFVNFIQFVNNYITCRNILSTHAT
jgi:hypothetical protein